MHSNWTHNFFLKSWFCIWFFAKRGKLVERFCKKGQICLNNSAILTYEFNLYDFVLYSIVYGLYLLEICAIRFQKSGTNCQTFLIKWSKHTFATFWLTFIFKNGHFWTSMYIQIKFLRIDHCSYMPVGIAKQGVSFHCTHVFKVQCNV